MADAVRRDVDGEEPAAPNERDDRFEWLDLDVPASCWWEVADHPELIRRGVDGWVFFSCTDSPEGDDRVVLTYYRPFKVPVWHGPRPVRRGRRHERGVCATRR
ncbi:hypothetical protein [Mycolicibacterium goodii]|uniref:hypothetical protein n=1 Tax=Mycolicibacterium goodii TaxID=134601 RepID=UPI00093A45AF|nr:hypothetical protein [Mycolicibacterium goodii]MBU8810894.1 hypothetical protein [Mycolicibacterium goodii]MBU8831595.1 hypothetical protein [Mycolicibacterium goodii]OKH67559.1 hypothetical protein EB74_01465 [Mycobacterium sp. SWH-M5]PJK21944.1 hypothetical protein CSX11_13040 [Mycolicibacterium goodii]